MQPLQRIITRKSALNLYITSYNQMYAFSLQRNYPSAAGLSLDILAVQSGPFEWRKFVEICLKDADLLYYCIKLLLIARI